MDRPKSHFRALVSELATQGVLSEDEGREVLECGIAALVDLLLQKGVVSPDAYRKRFLEELDLLDEPLDASGFLEDLEWEVDVREIAGRSVRDAEIDRWVEAFVAENHGFVDLDLKRKNKGAYYSFGAPSLCWAAMVPVDLEDLKTGQVEALSLKELGKNQGGCTYNPAFRLSLSKRELDELADAFPQKCACGFARFQWLAYSENSVGASAHFHCPHCDAVTDLKWEDTW
ncbi:MAG: hypothetical protein Q8P02_05540 [Candidatus Micrarchaeota archaeon]|nr:hypothetical protein [Candidatus Micrarchaeota archaeon]